MQVLVPWAFPGGSDGKESASNAGDPASIPGSGRSPGGGHGSPLQHLAWEIPWTEGPGGLHGVAVRPAERPTLPLS